MKTHLKPFVHRSANELTKLEYVATKLFAALIEKERLDERSMNAAISYAYELLLKCKENENVDTKQEERIYESM